MLVKLYIVKRPFFYLRSTEITPNTCTVAWVRPLGHTCLKGYQIHIKGADGKTFKDLAVPKFVKQFTIVGLVPASDYEINIISLCQAEDGKRTESEPFILSNVATKPEKVRNLRLDASAPTSLTIKWDAPVVSTNYKYKVSINGNTLTDRNDFEGSMDLITGYDGGGSGINLDQLRHKITEYASTIEVPGDKNQYTFSKLPEIIGTGHAYNIDVVVVATTSKEAEVSSDSSSGTFVTKPLAPTNFKIDKDKSRTIMWYRSMTPNVTKYRIRWKPSEEFANLDTSQKSEEGFATRDSTDNYLSYSLPSTLIVGAVYKVNIYAVVDVAGQPVESKELHEKIQVKDQDEITIYVEETKEQ